MTVSIKEIHLHQLKMRLKHPFTTSFGTMQDREFFITEVIDDQGNRGFGESVAFLSPWYSEETVETNLHVMRDFLIPLLKERVITHPDDVTEIFQPIKRHYMAKSALEGAIWDLYAKREGKSLAAALGGERKTIEVGVSIGIKSSIDELLEEIKENVDAGYKRIKIKIKPDWDVDVIREVRNHFPNIEMMADANSAYTLDDINHLKQLDEFDLMMIEQPLAHDDIIDHATLQQAMTTPICLDESIHSFDDTRQAIELGSCKVINIKIGRVGGLTEAIRIHDYCVEHGIDVWCGGMLEAGVGRAHNIAITTLAGFTLPGDTAGSSRYWAKDIITPEVTVEKGIIRVPDKPGIGYDIDEEALEQFTVKKHTFNF